MEWVALQMQELDELHYHVIEKEISVRPAIMWAVACVSDSVDQAQEQF